MNHSSEENEKSLDNLMFCITMLLVFIIAVRVPLDSDMWWHLTAGKWMVNNGKPLLVDVFSYTRAGEVWINHAWLGDVILYWFYRDAGFWGLGLCVAITAVASMGILYKTMPAGSTYKAWLVILAAIICSFVWSPRPQIFSLLMIAILLNLILRYRDQDTLKGSGWLFVVFVLWSNLHGGYSLGVILLILTGIGEIVDYLTRLDAHQGQHKRLKKNFIWILIALAGILVNPNGLNTLIIPFRTVGVQTLQTLIDEWASPDFHQLTMQPFVILLFLVILSFALTRKSIHGFEVIGFLGFTYLALVAKRNFAPFAIFSSFVVSNHLPSIFHEMINNLKEKLSDTNLKEKGKPASFSPLLRKVLNLTMVGLLGIGAVMKWFYVTHPVVVSAYESRFYPQKAISYLREYRIPSGRLFNSYGWGGYLIWNLPETAVFVDGRTDLFGDEVLGDWLKIIRADEGWEQTIDKWKIDWFLIEPEQPIVDHLIGMGWQVLYQDEISIVINRKNTQSH